MIKSLLNYINLLSSSVLGTPQQIEVLPSSTKTAIPVAVFCGNHRIPHKINKLVKFSNLNEGNLYFANIINALTSESIDTNKIKLWEMKKFIDVSNSDSNCKTYITLEVPSDKFYSFVWKKKALAELRKTERKIANYYGADPQSSIEFLYSYQEYKKPWAIKINDDVHLTMWVKGQFAPVYQGNSLDPFLSFHAEGEDKKIRLLLDENNRIIAKRFDKAQPVFRNEETR